MLFTSIKRPGGIGFNFRKPRTGEEIIKEIRENQDKYYNHNQFKIIEDRKEEKELAFNKEVTEIKKAKEENKEIIKNPDFKIAKIQKDFSTQTEKVLEEKLEKIDSTHYNVSYRIPNKILIKILLPLTNDINEKKKIVNEQSNINIDEAKKNKSEIKVTLNNKVYKIKFI